MIIKKLAVPLINDKLLQQVEHCCIATAAISETAFDFIKNRLPPKCKIEIVTGLDVLTSPMVLRRIWRHYQDRISLNIYTKNFFHANVYIFDLPYRKAVAFTGSGNFTLEGLKDNEEIFYKITDPKEIELLKSWFTGYYEFSEPLTEPLIQEYELIYPPMKQREIVSRQEKRQFIALTSGGFNWDNFKFKNQYFKKEDYFTFSTGKVALRTTEIQDERIVVQNKLFALHELITRDVLRLKLHPNHDPEQITGSIIPDDCPDHKLRSMGLAYGRSETELNKYSPGAKLRDFMTLQINIRQSDVGISLIPGMPSAGKQDREYFHEQMNVAEYRSVFFKLMSDLDNGYWIEIAGDRRAVSTFQNEDSLWDFTKSDAWRYYSFTIEKNYSPGDIAISSNNITVTITKEFDKLILLYRHMKDQVL